ncbi:MAG: MmcQ/YjbR family DNA-binding protein [Pseudomonadota bacterium]
MDIPTFDKICAKLPHATHVVQWGGAHVWKIGGKVFAVGWSRSDEDGSCPITLKVDEMASEFLRQEEGVEIAPYFRSPLWLRFQPERAISDADLAKYIARSREIVLSGLTKKAQADLAD